MFLVLCSSASQHIFTPSPGPTLPPGPHCLPCGLVRVNSQILEPPAKSWVWREKPVGVLPGTEGSEMRRSPLKLTNSTGIMGRTKKVNSVKSLECFKGTLCELARTLSMLGLPPLAGQDRCGCDMGASQPLAGLSTRSIGGREGQWSWACFPAPAQLQTAALGVERPQGSLAQLD